MMVVIPVETTLVCPTCVDDGGTVAVGGRAVET